MKVNKVKISEVKLNEDNPRFITEEKFAKLKRSILDFPEMLELRPIVVDENMVALGGNMRLRACKDIGLEEVPVVKAASLTEKQKAEFIIKDNVGFGQWDWDVLGNEWENKDLADWGLDVWQPEEEVDYSALDDLDLDNVVDDMQKNVKTAIQIEFESEDYEEAKELISKFRSAGAYIGGIILMYLKEKSREL